MNNSLGVRAAGAQSDLSREAPAATSHRGDALKALGAFAGFLLLIAVVWELIALVAGFNRLLFPPLSAIFESLWQMTVSGELGRETLATLGRMLVGYVVAVIVGVPLGLWMGRSQLAEDLFGPLVNFLLPIPALALVPLFVLWFGLTLTSALLIISLTSALPIVVNTWSGSKTINPILPRVARSMGVTGPRFFVKVVLPSALPSIIIGIRQGLSMAWRVAIGAEFFAVATTGLGVRMFEAKDYVQMDVILALLVVIMAISILLDKVVFAPLEARTIRRWGVGGTF